MKIKNKTLMKLSGLAIASGVRHWMKTLDYRGLYYDPATDPVNEQFHRTAIYVFWHEYIPFMFYLRGYNNVSMLVSRHQDAEYLSMAARHMGFDVVRGSSNRGGATALRQLLDRSERMNLTMTPDGPRGPRRKMAQGPIYLSSRLQMPLVAVGLGYDRPRRLNTWDNFAVPRFYSRARCIMSPHIQIPADLDRDGIEHHRQHMESILNKLTIESEVWAESGQRYEGEVILHRSPSPLRSAWNGESTDADPSLAPKSAHSAANSASFPIRRAA